MSDETSITVANLRIKYLEADIQDLRKKIAAITPMPMEEDRLRETLLIAEAKINSLQQTLKEREKTIASMRPTFSPPVQKTKRKNVAPTSIPNRRKIFTMSGGKCFFCREEVKYETFTIDHLVPTSKGGANDLKNKVTACWDCNNEKGDRLPTDEEIAAAKEMHSEFQAVQAAPLNISLSVFIDNAQKEIVKAIDDSKISSRN